MLAFFNNGDLIAAGSRKSARTTLPESMLALAA
jgi:hypothetical protein